MEQAPVIVFVVNSLGRNIQSELTFEEHVYEICNVQSVSASIENMLLAAIAFGYPGEFPQERPRKRMEDIVEWRS